MVKNKKIRKIEMNEKECNIVMALKKCLTDYKICKAIFLKHECIISEIQTEINIKRTTLYNHVERYHDMNLIYKDFSKGKQRNGSRFIIIARPRLERVLKEFRRIILEFAKKISDNEIVFDNKND